MIGHGRVYNLKHLHDFDGTYGAANGEATLGNGIGGRYLKNGNGVELRIDDITKVRAPVRRRPGHRADPYQGLT